MIKIKDKSNILLLSAFVLILFAIILTAILNKSGSNASLTDIRTKAGLGTSLKAEGIVSSIDPAQGVFTLKDLHFVHKNRDDSKSNLGEWTVSPPAGFNVGSLREGSTVTVTFNPTTFLTTTKTMTATNIETN